MGATVKEILELCKTIDEQAREIYTGMSCQVEEPELGRFWTNMAEQEGEHIGYWETLMAMDARESLSETVFDKPDEVKAELEHLLPMLDTLAVRSRSARDAPGTFLIGISMEFYMLHPAFLTLLRLLSDGQLEKDPIAEYEAHLEDLIESLGKLVEGVPELILLGDAVRRMWRQNKELQVRSHIDPLTGVLNRRGFYEVTIPLLYLAKRNRKPVGVLILDVDNFKQINDVHGHGRGDAVLRTVADTLQSQVRRSDVVAKFGGDEFLVFLSETQPRAVESLGEKLRRTVESKSRRDCSVTISVGGFGASVSGEIREELDSLIERADDCLLEAKDRGKNRVVVNLAG